MSSTITIYNAKGVAKAEVFLSKSSVCRREVGTTDYIKLVFTLPSPVVFTLGDYAEWDGKRYICNNQKKPSYNEDTASYKYELQLDAWYMMWNTRIFRFAPQLGAQEASWSYTGTLSQFLDIIITNLTVNRFYYNGAKKTGDTDMSYYIYSDDIEDIAEGKALSFSNNNIIDALNTLCDSANWDCEWWIEDNVIYLGKVYQGANVPMSIGANLKTMSSSASNTNYATRVYAFGSTRNIPSYYRKVLNFVAGGDVDISDSSKPLELSYLRDNAFEGGTRWENERQLNVPSISASIKDGSAITLERIILDEPLSTSYVEFLPFDNLVSYTVIGTKGLDSVDLKVSLLVLLEDSTQDTITMHSGRVSEFVYEKSLQEAIYDYLELDSVTISPSKRIEKVTLRVEIAPTLKDKDTADFELWVKAEGSFMMRTIKPVANNIQVTFADGTSATASLWANDNGRITLNGGRKTTKGITYTIENLFKSNIPSLWWKSVYDSILIPGVIEERLMLPSSTGGYIDAEENLDNTPERIVEAVAVFEDVYPKRESVITDIKTRILYDKIEQKDGSYIREQHDAYRVYNAEQDFDRQYIIKGETLGIHFQTGSLAGMEFDATFIAQDGNNKQCFEVVRNDTYGRTLPDETLHPKVGDKYVLLNFDIEYIGDKYIPEAEAELKQETEDYVAESKIDPNTYDCTMLSGSAYKLYQRSGRMHEYDLGQRIKLMSSAFFESGFRESRVIGYEYKMDIPYDTPLYIIGDKPKYSKLGDLSAQVDSVTYRGNVYNGISGGGGNNPKIYVIGANDNTAWSDTNVLSACRVLNDFISRLKDESTPYSLAIGKNLTVGGSASITETLSVLATTYLQALKAQSLTDYTYKAGDHYEGGQGFALYNQNGKSTLEVDNLLVRLKAVFSELEVRKLSSVGGNIVLSLASSTIEHVTGDAGSYRCYLNADDGSMSTTNAWMVGDIVRCQTFNIEEGTTYNAHNKNYYAHVTYIGEDSEGKYIDIVQALVDGADGIPEAGDIIVQMGNLTDSTRGNVIILTTSGENSPSIIQYSGINSYDITPFMATQISPEGNIFRAKSFEFVSDAGTTRIPNNRGNYDNTKTYAYYDEVSYNGSLWLCTNMEGAKVGSIPSKTNTDWLILVEKGKDGADGGAYTCYFENPSIIIPANDNGNIQADFMTSSKYHIYYGGTEITDSYMASVIDIVGASAMVGNGEVVLTDFTSDGYCTIECRSQESSQILKATVSFVIVKGGIDGASLFTWIMYADSDTGIGISSNPQGKSYIGIAYNKNKNTPSTDPQDYTWAKIQGAQGIQGEKGDTGAQGSQGVPGEAGQPAYSATLSRSSAFVGVGYNDATYEKIAIQPILSHGDTLIPAKDISVTTDAKIDHCTTSINDGVITILSIANLKEGYTFNVILSYKGYHATLPFRYEVVNVGFGTDNSGKGVSMYASYVDDNNEVHKATIGVLAEDTSGQTIVKLSGEQISLEGYTTINGNTTITEDGTLVAKDAVISGTIQEGSTMIENGLRTPFKKLYLDIDEGIINESKNTIISSVYDTYSGIWNVRLDMRSDFFMSFPSEYVAEEIMLPTDASQIGRHVLLCNNKPVTEDSQVTAVFAPYETIGGKMPSNSSFVGGIVSFHFQYGVVELLAIPNTESENHCQWLIRSALATIEYDRN